MQFIYLLDMHLILAISQFLQIQRGFNHLYRKNLMSPPTWFHLLWSPDHKSHKKYCNTFFNNGVLVKFLIINIYWKYPHYGKNWWSLRNSAGRVALCHMGQYLWIYISISCLVILNKCAYPCNTDIIRLLHHLEPLMLFFMFICILAKQILRLKNYFNKKVQFLPFCLVKQLCSSAAHARTIFL